MPLRSSQGSGVTINSGHPVGISSRPFHSERCQGVLAGPATINQQQEVNFRLIAKNFNDLFVSVTIKFRQFVTYFLKLLSCLG